MEELRRLASRRAPDTLQGGSDLEIFWHEWGCLPRPLGGMPWQHSAGISISKQSIRGAAIYSLLLWAGRHGVSASSRCNILFLPSSGTKEELDQNVPCCRRFAICRSLWRRLCTRALALRGAMRRS